ncbi:Vitamin B12 import ATP-binding protein BtuD [Pleomorphomonas sp. T1.2MG-36]|uniref:ABC transporter ATP-binding protein n=1 Tax=Pleomorphomonas sp. T1.2MG-36 TaxID=3041167 RepID=UPI0024774EF9|nr:ABC transporter ATP-binding protein [Pleomorphomonas sp. T1.2MG-36]CAI9418113.1 Vitamin B12 import ATP-binding protein BtuD [Pleomorphomonas sp. T1.2MG-36]
MTDIPAEGALPEDAGESRASGTGGPDYLASLKLLGRFLPGSRLAMGGAILLATAAVACELAPIVVVCKVVTPALSGTLGPAYLLGAAGLALLAVVVGYGLMGLAVGLSHVVAFDVLCRLRLALARHLARLPIGWFADRKSGDAKKLIIDEPESMELIFAHGIPEGVSALATWVAVSVWLFAVDWRMALATVAVTPVAFVLISTGMARGARRAADYQRAGARMNASVVEFLAGMAVVKIFNRTGESFAETARAVRAYAEVETAWAEDYLPFGGTFFSLVLANVVVILPVGAFLMAAGSLDLSTLVLFVILGANYSQPLMKLFNQFHTLAHISMGSTRIADALAAEPQADSARTVALASHDVVFDEVSFGYGKEEVLHRVSFTAPAGSVTALVGPSGAGKSTVASLVARFWDPRSGRVTLGGVDLREIGLAQLMDMVAFVFQDSFLFSDTIAANIRFGNPKASDAEVEAAARAARAHDFIMAFPDGYATRLGDRGQLLSGGERQRIAIARAILKDAPVIVLDEATAFADPDNEAAIQEAIGELTAGRTLLVVAHRLHTIMSADQILVVDGGRIAEAGRHDDLVAKGGLYARLWRDYTEARDVVLKPAGVSGQIASEERPS